ncbi:MAG: hypothetical protein FJW88_07455 [Actinobacteria bacterium]|nr:hypothetical protein [Actinomycetota bacterium]
MGENKRLLAILAIGGVIVAALVAYNLFGKGGGEEATTSTPAPAVTSNGPAGGTATTTTTTPGAPSVPGGEFDVFATRDPFEPVVSVTPVTTTPTTTSSATTATTTSGATTATTTAQQNPSGGTSVALLDVFDEGGVTKARVQVGSTVYTVAPGETFAVSYRLVSISGTCGQFLYGDAPFQLCEGEAVIK